jgi:hypothetical protein
VLEHLVEHLRRGQAPPHVLGHRRDRRLEDLIAPAGRDDRLRHLALLGALDVVAVARDVVEHPPGLVLLRVEAGQLQ